MRRPVARREAQVGSAKLRHLSPGAQAGELQGRIYAARDDDWHVGRKVVEQESDDAVDAFGIDLVVGVKDYEQLVGDAGYLVDQGSRQCFDTWRFRRTQRRENTLLDPLLNRSQCGYVDKTKTAPGGCLTRSVTPGRGTSRPHSCAT